MDNNEKKKILIVDDSEINRALLSDMLSVDFDIIEAEDGLEAIAILHEQEMNISLMLLDIVMPNMDGYEVLAKMNQTGWIKNIPVIIISAETSGAYIDRAYDLGAIDYISRPFDERTVKHRVMSNFMLTLKQREMSEMLSAQIFEKEKDNSLMIEILSHIVEFRNGESGLHVLHVHAFTDMILKHLVKKTDKYPLTYKDIRLIGNASALHDVGKITIPSAILNKPGRFTDEEFNIMKSHTVAGAKMLGDIPFRGNEALIKIGYEICRWHHERYDGRGYPDGLKGEEIPISAQVVALADVYDALTSKRVYKPAYTHEEALKMILGGECGCFNPLLLECLKDMADQLKEELHVMSFGVNTANSIQESVTQMLKNEGTDMSNRTVKLIEYERMKFKYLTDISREIVFEYITVPEMIQLSEWSADTLGLPQKILDPVGNELWNRRFNKENFVDFLEKMKSTTPENSIVSEKYQLSISGEKKWYKVTAKVLWSDGELPEIEGAIGKIVDINAETQMIDYLEEQANCDAKTGLFNYNAAKRCISDMLAQNKDKKYALVMFDIDNFKGANDEYGHLFGDEVLDTIAQRLKENIRSTDIAARMGGDEFMFFVGYKGSVLPQIKRIFNCLTQKYKQFDVGVSMGVALTDGFNGDFDELFKRADAAMYSVKRDGKCSYRFYDESMKNSLRGEDER